MELSSFQKRIHVAKKYLNNFLPPEVKDTQTWSVSGLRNYSEL